MIVCVLHGVYIYAHRRISRARRSGAFHKGQEGTPAQHPNSIMHVAILFAVPIKIHAINGDLLGAGVLLHER